MNKSPKLSAIFIHDADSILPDSIFLLPYFEKVRQKPRTLECVVLVFVIKTNIENFTINNKLLICQLSKLLKSYVSYKLSLVNYQSVWTLIVNNHRIRR
ncbi:hypothetical protein VroAM7_29000 [Vibrio rotiferianus]|uniref:Uncharacterized protein n=1 Tax=Vibrio rotiferianus TaxID=190895 RepID=A0A510I9I9_9VIBR|nr:hypothetical protein VroAM7_27160 [Vibrio rotiferianus]BBL90216.1 hypothetical protein VroAM7_28690 [Vibrio rotiferianus]BBL90247.1 hypothetical protein VroAM7_29000 [Vibrio rotiferianus]